MVLQGVDRRGARWSRAVSEDAMGIDEIETDDDDAPYTWGNMYYPWGIYPHRPWGNRRYCDSDDDLDNTDDRYKDAEEWYWEHEDC